MALIRVQDFRCAYCGKAFLLNGYRFSPRTPTVEHVWPRRDGHSRVGNTVAVHRRCNQAKAGRMPTGCELISLEIVNAKRSPGCIGNPPSHVRSEQQQPILSAIDALNAHMERRHSWLKTASEQIRKWREEDARNGIEWGRN
jgi:hypothetical protein